MRRRRAATTETPANVCPGCIIADHVFEQRGSSHRCPTRGEYETIRDRSGAEIDMCGVHAPLHRYRHTR